MGLSPQTPTGRELPLTLHLPPALVHSHFCTVTAGTVYYAHLPSIKHQLR